MSDHPPEIQWARSTHQLALSPPGGIFRDVRIPKERAGRRKMQSLYPKPQVYELFAPIGFQRGL